MERNVLLFVATLFLVSIGTVTGWAQELPAPGTLEGSPEADPHKVEEVYVVRSVRTSRVAPTEFCAKPPMASAEAVLEDRYVFLPVTTRATDGAMVSALGRQTASLRACFGQTDDPQAFHFYGEGEIAGLSFTGRGQCRQLKNDFPEPGLSVWTCFLDLSGLREPYLGGVLTTSTINSQTPLGQSSNPPGYTQPSIATVRLWSRRNARADAMVSQSQSKPVSGDRPTQGPSQPGTAAPAAAAKLPPQMAVIINALSGSWSTTLAKVDAENQEHVNGWGNERWQLGPGGIPFIEENRQMLNGDPADDYAALWWDAKAQKIRGIWCEARINDEGCSGFDVTLEGNDVVMNGEWIMRGRRWAWREVYSTSKGELVQTLYTGEPGKKLRRISVIRGTRY